ncbi:hypothetical protein TGAM01_v205981 [Trichoderma gamsii]|uniref:Glucose-methanol-choline oxidoreductase C-terminal domain-containing protein n=1 Tax=Trichoderma gamsii TaxID=398673 RepID=A0A2P4ZM09_9HYPO|nr:hypothetical protein TGAM01_v205981 [Trichoderma gamsii]PON25295.1 hypothetical protein TGAM01_v205981 [Trichoderma gamsii]
MKPFRDNIFKAWKSTGKPVTESIYDGEINGLYHGCDTICKGVRSGSYLFLKDKPNITVPAEAHAKKLLISYADRVCRNVHVVLLNGKDAKLYSDLNGVGPARELKEFDIDVIVDSRHVGQNLMNHPAVPFVLRVKLELGMDTAVLRKGPENEKMHAQYKRDHSGLADSGFLEVVGFPRIDEYLENDPDYQKAKKANGGRDPFSPEGQPHVELDFVCLWGSAFQWHFPPPPEGEHTTAVVDLIRPISGPGEVTLKSADPLEQPYINLNFFADELDIIAMREGIRFTYDVLTKVDGFKDQVISESPWPMPLYSNSEMKRAVLDRCQTAFHPVGTARLSKNIEQGVVDPALKVHGVHNLRVIDASAIPLIPDCRIQHSVYAVAEKGADMIKADHKDLSHNRAL